MPDIVRLDLADDRDLARWQDYILQHPAAQYADLGQWRRIFASLYGIRNVTLLCVDGERPVGAASLYRIDSPFFGRLLVTCPFFGAGGLYADDATARAALVDALEQAASDERVDFIELRSRQPLDPALKPHDGFVDFDLTLADSEQAVWDRQLSSNTRQNIRKARKFPLEFSMTDDPVEPFGLISTTIRDLGSPFHPRRLFELMVDHLGDAVRFSQVHFEGRLIAAGVLVRFRDRLSTPMIGSLTRYRHTRANYCQYWNIVRHCLEGGVRHFELGRSPRGSSHQRFKQKWGAEPVPLYYGHIAVSGRRAYRTVLEPGRLEQLVSRTWTHLPVSVTRVLGPRIVRYIP